MDHRHSHVFCMLDVIIILHFTGVPFPDTQSPSRTTLLVNLRLYWPCLHSAQVNVHGKEAGSGVEVSKWGNAKMNGQSWPEHVVPRSNTSKMMVYGERLPCTPGTMISDWVFCDWLFVGLGCWKHIQIIPTLFSLETLPNKHTDTRCCWKNAGFL